MYLYQLKQAAELSKLIETHHPEPLKLHGEAAVNTLVRIQMDQGLGYIKGPTSFHGPIRENGGCSGIEIDIASMLKSCVEEIKMLRSELKKTRGDLAYEKSRR